MNDKKGSFVPTKNLDFLYSIENMDEMQGPTGKKKDDLLDGHEGVRDDTTGNRSGHSAARFLFDFSNIYGDVFRI